MKILVKNCFHWIGFHLVSHLLEEGIAIDGIDQLNTNKKQFLNMFFGRNDRFNLLENDTCHDNPYDLIIKIDNESENTAILFERRCQTGVHKQSVIHLPVVIGEWMPGEEIAQHEKLRAVNALDRAIHIDSLVKVIYQWIKTNPHMPDTLKIISSHTEDLPSDKLEKYVCLRDNRAIWNDVNEILDHYYRFKSFY